MATRVLTLGFAAILAACSGDPHDDPATGGAGANSAGAAGAGSGGARGGAESEGGAAGSRNIGGSSGAAGVAQGGLGGQATPEEIRQAVDPKCEEACYLGNQACPDFSIPTCAATCRRQADDFATSGRCGLEHYRGIECYIEFLKTTDSVGCSTQGPIYMGCTTEVAAYNECIGK